MADFARAFTQAFAAGRQIKQAQDAAIRQGEQDARQAQLDAEAAEDRKLEREGLKIRLQAMKLEEKLRPRLAAMERIKYLETLQPNQMPFEASEPRPDGMNGMAALIAGARPESKENALPGSMRAQADAAMANPLQFKPVTVPGVEELGLQADTIRPRTVQEVLAEAMRKERMSILMKPITSKPGEVTEIPLTGEVIAKGGEAPPASDMERQIKILSDEFEAQNGRAPNALEKAKLLRDSKQLARDPQMDALNASIKQLQITQLRDKVAAAHSQGTPAQLAAFKSLTDRYEASPLVKAKDRTVVLQSAVRDIRENAEDPTNQMALAYAYIQALDTYQSAVKEGELQSLGSLGTKLQQLKVKANQITESGAFMPPEVAKDIATNAERLITTIESGRAKVAKRFGYRAKIGGIEGMWNDFAKMVDGDETGGASDTVGPDVSSLLKQAGPGRHTLSDGTIWIVGADGSVQQVKQ